MLNYTEIKWVSIRDCLLFSFNLIRFSNSALDGAGRTTTGHILSDKVKQKPRALFMQRRHLGLACYMHTMHYVLNVDSNKIQNNLFYTVFHFKLRNLLQAAGNDGCV